ncbi:PLDc N-terminal domain-containing protein [Corynebacterium pelargi]|uniref:Cardiolipin synthase N-terminal domain-containing protein n=1 Tax=Corynebacterium pelargi TaxID=1471400 RepID=A0A410W8Q5_9CORY|nr:PLDc N-terminal domain-containing protein [Corynebacterium pelargi]QAU52334.1 hypothetical protein CPELA_05310 [Corynebacterium pelargi]
MDWIFWLTFICVFSAVYVTITELRREASAAQVGLWAAACLVFPILGFIAWFILRKNA